MEQNLPNSDNSSTFNASTPVVVAVVEGRGVAKGTIGLASIDRASGVIEVRQFVDTPEYVFLSQRLEVFQEISSTTEVIIPNTMNEEKSQYIIRSKFGSHMNPIDRANFSDAMGVDCIKKLSQNPDHLLRQVQDKPFCLSALAALIAYVENNTQSNFCFGALKICYKSNEDSMVIDNETVVALELLASKNGQTKGLFDFLNHCSTRGGWKLLRTLILEPSTDIKKIRNSQDAVGELKLKSDYFKKLQEFVQLIQVDLEMVITRIIQVPRSNRDTSAHLEANIDLLVYLRHIIERIDLLVELLSSLESELFKELNRKLKDCDHLKILELIRVVISDECVLTKGCVNFKTTKVFAVRKNLSPYLEIERDSYTETLHDLTECVENIKREYKLNEGCRMIYTVARGFHLHINAQEYLEPPIPTAFIRCDFRGQALFCTTEKLTIMNSRLQYKQKEIERMSSVFVEELLAEVRQLMDPLYVVAEVIAEVDFLVSLTAVAIKYHLVKPQIDEDETDIEDGRHPILMAMANTGDKKSVEGEAEKETIIIPNNTHLSPVTNFHLVTGPNMAGKSVYIRQVAVLQILAQIGCHVPASQAKFRICDKIFARIGSDDDIETNCSTFKSELKQINYIIDNLSDRSLVVIDELGRGTSDEEGVGICFAVAEHLIQSKAFTLFATHFQDLHELTRLYYNVLSYRFASNNLLDYTHKLEERNDDVGLGDYGVDLAEKGGFPPVIVQNARGVLQKIKKGRPQVANGGSAENLRLKYRIADHITKLAAVNKQCPIQNLPQFLETIRSKAIKELKKIQQRQAQ